jgi:hypothetical protein
VVLAAPEGHALQQVASGPQGDFAFTSPIGTAPVHLRIYAERGGARLGLPALVMRDVVAGAVEVLVRLPADALPSSRVRGRVVGEDGRPLSRFSVHIVDPAVTLRGTYEVDDPVGAFDLGPLPAGTWEVHVFAPDARAPSQWLFRCGSGPIELDAGEALHLGTLAIAPLGSLRLAMKGDAWRARANLTYMVSGTEVRWFGAIEGETTLFPYLAPGRYQVSVTDPSAATPTLATALIEPARTTTIEIELR